MESMWVAGVLMARSCGEKDASIVTVEQRRFRLKICCAAASGRSGIGSGCGRFGMHAVAGPGYRQPAFRRLRAGRRRVVPCCNVQ